MSEAQIPVDSHNIRRYCRKSGENQLPLLLRHWDTSGRSDQQLAPALLRSRIPFRSQLQLLPVLRRGAGFAVLVERAGEILRDVVGGAPLDLMTLEHIDELTVLEQRDLG
jgi:hypothetical protein